MKYTEEDLSRLDLYQRVVTINELLEGSSLKRLLLNDVEVSKGKLKQLLKPYEYNTEVRKFELPIVTEECDQEVERESGIKLQSGSVVELLIDIKSLLQSNVNYQKECNDLVLQMITNEVAIVNQNHELKIYKALKGDDLITRSFKIYDSINERLKLATKNSDLNQQQLFNTLMDKALRELGF